MQVGRPRVFDSDIALERAMEVFWREGYEGASLADLTRAMGINRPSMYATFGNKEALFRKALDRYIEGPASYIHEALKEPTARAVVERLLQEAIEVLTNPSTPSGCLLVQGALACGEEGAPIQRELILRRIAGEAAIRERFEQAKASADLPADADPADLACYISTILQGMAVQTASRASREELQRLAKLVLRTWPT